MSKTIADTLGTVVISSNNTHEIQIVVTTKQRLEVTKQNLLDSGCVIEEVGKLTAEEATGISGREYKRSCWGVAYYDLAEGTPIEEEIAKELPVEATELVVEDAELSKEVLEVVEEDRKADKKKAKKVHPLLSEGDKADTARADFLTKYPHAVPNSFCQGGHGVTVVCRCTECGDERRRATQDVFQSATCPDCKKKARNARRRAARAAKSAQKAAEKAAAAAEDTATVINDRAIDPTAATAAEQARSGEQIDWTQIDEQANAAE